jgi:hypothetical protein
MRQSKPQVLAQRLAMFSLVLKESLEDETSSTASPLTHQTAYS